MSDRLLRDAALCFVVAAVAIMAWTISAIRTEESWDGRTGTTLRFEQPLPAPTEDATAAPVMVMLVSPTLTPTMIGYVPPPTKTPEPTETTIPACIEGVATPERLCKTYLPTWTPIVNTPISVYGTGTPQVNALYFWPADE